MAATHGLSLETLATRRTLGDAPTILATDQAAFTQQAAVMDHAGLILTTIVGGRCTDTVPCLDVRADDHAIRGHDRYAGIAVSANHRVARVELPAFVGKQGRREIQIQIGHQGAGVRRLHQRIRR